MADAIPPTLVIPAGAPLPVKPQPTPAAAAPPPPPRPPRPPAAAPAAPAPGPPPVGLVIHEHHHHLVLPTPPAEPRRDWHWLTSRIRPAVTGGAALIALTPWAGGHSPTAGWAGCLHQERASSLSGAYVLAGVALAAALGLEAAAGPRSTRVLRLAARAALIIAVIGGTGALGWYDPITALTGVRPS